MCAKLNVIIVVVKNTNKSQKGHLWLNLKADERQLWPTRLVLPNAWNPPTQCTEYIQSL